jgi:hypothetical protein
LMHRQLFLLRLMHRQLFFLWNWCTVTFFSFYWCTANFFPSIDAPSISVSANLKLFLFTKDAPSNLF